MHGVVYGLKWIVVFQKMYKPVEKNVLLGIEYETEEYYIRIPLQTTVTVY
jgi:hypothetical protein